MKKQKTIRQERPQKKRFKEALVVGRFSKAEVSLHAGWGSPLCREIGGIQIYDHPQYSTSTMYMQVYAAVTQGWFYIGNDTIQYFKFSFKNNVICLP